MPQASDNHYFAAHSAKDFGDNHNICSVQRVLLIQAIYAGDKLELKTIWLDVPSWECRVFALKSTIIVNTLHFYVFGWDMKALQA